VIVNADSAQIYKDLPILSAAPTALQQREAEHRLYGIADGAKACSASDWAKLARRQIEELQGQGRTPILVGGTGLYIRTLLEGIAPVPPIDPDVRASVRHATVEANRAKLEQVDRDASRKIGPNDKTRIARALEVVLSTGRTLAEWQRYREGGIADRVDLRAMILEPPRDWLYARCNERFATMVEEGAIAEVQALIERKLEPHLPVMRAIGVPELARYLAGECSLREAIVAGQQATRRYAKRQFTWFAHQSPSDWPRFSRAVEEDQLAAAVQLVRD